MHGRLGLGDIIHTHTFTAVPTLVAKQVIAGSGHTMVLTEDGTVYGCGDNDSGQLGLPDDRETDTFTAVPPLTAP